MSLYSTKLRENNTNVKDSIGCIYDILREDSSNESDKSCPFLKKQDKSSLPHRTEKSNNSGRDDVKTADLLDLSDAQQDTHQGFGESVESRKQPPKVGQSRQSHLRETSNKSDHSANHSSREGSKTEKSSLEGLERNESMNMVLSIEELETHLLPEKSNYSCKTDPTGSVSEVEECIEKPYSQSTQVDDVPSLDSSRTSTDASVKSKSEPNKTNQNLGSAYSDDFIPVTDDNEDTGVIRTPNLRSPSLNDYDPEVFVQKSRNNLDARSRQERSRTTVGLKGNRTESQSQRRIRSAAIQTVEREVLEHHLPFLPMTSYSSPSHQQVNGSIIDEEIVRVNYNQCVSVIEDVIKKQLNHIREFLSTQQKLHHALNTAIDHLITTDYVTWNTTNQLLKSKPYRQRKPA